MTPTLSTRPLLLSRRYLLTLLRRAPGRRARYRQQAGRRRPWLLRPLTAGERTLLRMRTQADELHRLLAPFRATRARGHLPLLHLLDDADTRPTVVAQARQLQTSLDTVALDHAQLHRLVEGFRREWDYATEARREHIRTVEKGHGIARQLRAYALLLAEGRADLELLHQQMPTAFAAPAAPEPWLDSSAATSGPTPYSA